MENILEEMGELGNDENVSLSRRVSDVSVTNNQQLEVATLKREKEDLVALFEQEKIRLLQQMNEIMQENARLELLTFPNNASKSEQIEEIERRNNELFHQIDILASDLETSERTKRELSEALSDAEKQLRSMDKMLHDRDKQISTMASMYESP
jgi:chromosome segregation ATPase